MVDKSIGELVAASQINDNDLFVLEQNGEAKKLLGNVLKQNIGSGSNRNLLDNPWFTVNQRGQSSYTGSAYTVDRWKNASSGTVTVNDGVQIEANNVFYQIIDQSAAEHYKGKMMTASVLYSDGQIDSFSDVFPNDGSVSKSFSRCKLFFAASIEGFGFNFPAFAILAEQDVAVRAVKLELGEVSTLANDTEPNYAEELAKCQRYFQTIGNTEDIFVIGYGIKASTTAIRWVLPIQNMRAIPTVTKIKATSAFLDFVGNSGDKALPSINMTAVAIAPNGVTFVSDGLSNLSDAVYICQAVRVKIELSADL